MDGLFTGELISALLKMQMDIFNPLTSDVSLEPSFFSSKE